jgi:hypothetical protein
MGGWASLRNGWISGSGVGEREGRQGGSIGFEFAREGEREDKGGV